jgi:hypothetical protein
MSAKMPPVPPENRSHKGPGSAPEAPKDSSLHNTRPDNLEQQDRQANTKQNTTHQGYQQDR